MHEEPSAAGEGAEPGAVGPDATAAPRLGAIFERAQGGVAGLWEQAGSEGRSWWTRLEAEAQKVRGRLSSLAGLPRDEAERLFGDFRSGLLQQRARVDAQLDDLGRLRRGLAKAQVVQELARLRKRLAALEFRIRSLEGRARGQAPPEGTAER